MTKKYLLYTFLMMLFIFFAAFALNILILVPPTKGNLLVSPDQVVSTSLYYKEEPYLLNFSQQKEFVKLLNQATQKSKIDIKKIRSFYPQNQPIQKISIQKFRSASLELEPIGLINGKMVLRLQTENEGLYLIEKEKNSFKDLFSQSHD